MPCASILSQSLIAVVPLTWDRRIEWFSWGLIILLVGGASGLLLFPNARRRVRDFVEHHVRLLAALAVLGSALAVVVYYRYYRSQPSSTLRTTASRPVAPARSGTSWPMDRSDLTRRGTVGTAAGPTAAGVRWIFARDDEAYYSSPCVVGNRIYCVASRGENGRIVCLDADSGQQVWSTVPPSYRSTFSSPVVADDLLLCGEGLHSTRRARLVALDLRAGRQGEVLWTLSTNSHIECTPTIADGKAYFGAGDDGIYCLDISAQAQDRDVNGGPSIVFHLSGRDYPDAETSLAVHAGRLYVGLGIGGTALCVLDGQTGREIKRISMPYPVFSPPSIDGQKLYLGMGSGDFARPGDAQSGQVTCIDIVSLEIEWTMPLPGTVLGAVAVDGDELFWGCGDGRVYRMQLADRSLASYDSGAPIAASVAVTHTTVFAVNEAGTLVALDRSTLTPRFRCPLGPAGRYVSSPAVFGHYLVVGTPSNGLLCVGVPSVAGPPK